MSTKKKITKAMFIIGIILLIFTSPVIINMISSLSTDSDKAGPIYDVAIASETQQSIWKLCQENDFAYELLLSIYHEEGIQDRSIQEVEKDISELTVIRDYWIKEGYSDEDAFDFTIISRSMGVEECLNYVKNNPEYRDNEYLKGVTEYKYEIEQSLESIPPTNQ